MLSADGKEFRFQPSNNVVAEDIGVRVVPEQWYDIVLFVRASADAGVVKCKIVFRCCGPIVFERPKIVWFFQVSHINSLLIYHFIQFISILFYFINHNTLFFFHNC
jgi:hypothetical protein